MLDFIYTLFIAPLEYWMKVVLLWGHDKCANWGLAIILMSLVVNCVILPIYMKAESWQEEEQRRRLSFEAKEAMIRRSFRGQERFAMISTMRRQAGYTAFLSMRSSVGFFLQIPFFFAAYHFLSHFDPLVGVSFMGLTDLSRPDEIAHIGPIPVNFMPILMTVINVGSALVYTKNLGKRDKIQLYSMAALFLVLLYDAASGLVLYWTCNNIFSLAKNIVYDLSRKLSPWLSQLNLRWEWPEVPARPVGRIGLLALGLWIAGLVLGLLSSNQVAVFSGPQRIMMSSAATGLYVLALLWCIKEAVSLLTIRGKRLLALFVLSLSVGCVVYWCKGTFGRAKPFFVLLMTLWSMVPVLLVTFERYRPKTWLYPKDDPSVLYAPSAFWLVILLCDYLPVQAYCTAPELFSSPEVVLAKALLYSALLGAVFYLAGWVWRALGVIRTASAVMAFVALWFTLYAFLLPLDVGTIDGFQVAHPERLYRGVNLAVDGAVFVALATLFYLCLKRASVSLVRVCLTFACCASLCASILELWSTQGRWMSDTQSKEVALPAYHDAMLGFSKQGKNTLVFVLDMFSGRHFEAILKENPELGEKLDGFTWFPDTLTQGTRTQTSIATLICGNRCTVKSLNEGRSEPLVEKINRRYAEAIDAIGDNGLDAFVNEHCWLESQRIARYAKTNVEAVRFLSSAYLNRYARHKGIEIDSGASDGFLNSVSLFAAVPWAFKSVVYFDGNWLTQAISHWANDNYSQRLQEWAFLDSLPHLSNADAKRDTYKFFHSELTHYPWLMTPGSCEIIRNPTPGQNGPQKVVETCAMKALGRWFDWMRKAGVYDNTTIVVTSDHGSDASRLNPLLIMKPAGAPHRPIVRSESLMSLTDVPAMASGLLVPNGSPKGFVRPRQTYSIDKVMEDAFKGAREFTVRGPITDKRSWPANFPAGDIPQ